MSIKHFTILLLSILFVASCEKAEKPYPLPEPGSANFDKLDIGDNYQKHIFYSLEKGIIAEDSFTIWDFCFTQDFNHLELWLNGGKGNLIYKTEEIDFTKSDYSIPVTKWNYDSPTWNPKESAFGIIKNEDLQKVWLLKIKNKTFKFQIISFNDVDGIQLKFGSIDDSLGTLHQLEPNSNYSYLYFSAENGPIQIEPNKEKWDILFTRYRHIFYGENPDGSDMPYFVNGVLLNPYQTMGAADTLNPRNFDDFTIDTALMHYELTKQRDIIGYHWKEVNINNSEYTILPKRIYLIRDQQDRLWKIHFVNFYNDDGLKGKPQFEFQQIQ